MAVSPTHEVTQLLKAWTAGDQKALEKLTPLVYEQLHRVAQHYMAGQRPGHTSKRPPSLTRFTCGSWTVDR